MGSKKNSVPAQLAAQYSLPTLLEACRIAAQDMYTWTASAHSAIETMKDVEPTHTPSVKTVVALAEKVGTPPFMGKE